MRQLRWAACYFTTISSSGTWVLLRMLLRVIVYAYIITKSQRSVRPPFLSFAQSTLSRCASHQGEVAFCLQNIIVASFLLKPKTNNRDGLYVSMSVSFSLSFKLSRAILCTIQWPGVAFPFLPCYERYSVCRLRAADTFQSCFVFTIVLVAGARATPTSLPDGVAPDPAFARWSWRWRRRR